MVTRRQVTPTRMSNLPRNAGHLDRLSMRVAAPVLDACYLEKRKIANRELSHAKISCDEIISKRNGAISAF